MLVENLEQILFVFWISNSIQLKQNTYRKLKIRIMQIKNNQYHSKTSKVSFPDQKYSNQDIENIFYLQNEDISNYINFFLLMSRHQTHEQQQIISKNDHNSNKSDEKLNSIPLETGAGAPCVNSNNKHTVSKLQQIKTINGISLQKYQRNYSPISPKILQIFKQLNKKLQEGDFSSLLNLENQITNNLNFINRNWADHQQQIKVQIEKFCDLISIKLETMKFTDKIYIHLIPIIKEIKKKIINLNKFDNNYKRPSLQDKKSDILFKHFIQEQNTKSKREGIYFVKNQNSDMRIALSDYIAQCESLFDDSKWQQIYLKEQHYINETQNDQVAFIRKRRKHKFDGNIHLERTPNIDCLGCTEFYYMNMNIYNYEVNNCKMALVGSIGDITENSSLVKYEICALLNGGGGVLLFNCQRFYLNVLPWGQLLTQKKKVQIEEKIYSYLMPIYPKPNVPQNVQVTFVPIKEDPFESDHNGQMEKHGDDGCQYHNRKYIKGLYVTRIRVSPSNGRTAYLLSDNETSSYIPIRIKSIFDSQKSKIQIKGKEIAKFIKKRFAQYQYEINESYSKAKKSFLVKKYSDFNHQCKRPDSGQFIYNKKEILKSTSKKPINEKDFKFASIIVCHKERHEQVKLKLKRYKVNCEIEMPFKNTSSSLGTNNFAIIYHNTQFNVLLQIICWHNFFKFDSKSTVVILITDYIRLLDRNASSVLTIQHLNFLQQSLVQEDLKQQISMWEYLNEKSQIQIYLETESRSSSYLLFLILNFKITRAIFKNPKDIDKSKVGKRKKLMNFNKVYPGQQKTKIIIAPPITIIIRQPAFSFLVGQQSSNSIKK